MCIRPRCAFLFFIATFEGSSQLTIFRPVTVGDCSISISVSPSVTPFSFLACLPASYLPAQPQLLIRTFQLSPFSLGHPIACGANLISSQGKVNSVKKPKKKY
ncbi:hypothetical protein GE09DRAFT_116632 [Coniochaeta sp. 2T2.1]|nr:hypothetical protein GE09DRAFT_116632 [Coniochaeta sp. 2T2.1]